MTLPVLGNPGDDRQVGERVNRLIREFNRTDLSVPIYAADTGSATAYVITPAPGIRAYAVGQIFAFKAANANSGTTPTLNVNGLGAGTISLPSGAVAAGDIAANGMTLVVVASTTPTFHLLNPVVSPVPTNTNRCLQTVSTITGAVATGTTTIPFDNTKPQSSEGDQYMSLAITPQSASSTLVIDVTWHGCNSTAGANVLTAALFRDSGADSLAAGWQTFANSNFPISISYRYTMASPGTSATTFKVRAGCNAAGTTTFNGQSGGRIYGGVLASGIVIKEVLA